MQENNPVILEEELEHDDLHDWLMDESDSVSDLYQEINTSIISAIELTKLVVTTEQAQDVKLDRQAIFEIFTQAVDHVNQGIATLGRDI